MSLSAQCSKSQGRDIRAFGLSASRNASRSPFGSPDSKSRNDLGACGVEVELAARPVGPCSASFDKTCLGIENRLQGAAGAP